MRTATLSLTFGLGALLSLPALAQTRNIPAPPQSEPILVVGARAHLGNGQTLDNAAIAFEQGRLTVVSDQPGSIDRSHYARVIDAAGKHVYPGLILPATDLGLNEVSSVRATQDAAEQGDFNPSVRALVAYNTDSELIPTLRFNGILLAQPTPQGGTLSGTSSIVQLDAWNWEDAAYVADDAVHVNWPARRLRPSWRSGEREARPNPDYGKQVDELRRWFSDARAYGRLDSHGERNLHLEALQGLFNGRQGLFLHTDDAKSIIEGVELGRRFGIERIVIVGAEEALLVKEFLKQNRVPVILPHIHSAPARDHEDTVYPFKLPAELYRAGVEFAIGDSGEMTARARNLPFEVGTAIAYGLPYEAGVEAVTGGAARILGIGDRTGTLEAGKDATFVISSGDLFDMRTNNIEHAFIQGREIQREGRQQFLYRKYSEKYGLPIR